MCAVVCALALGFTLGFSIARWWFTGKSKSTIDVREPETDEPDLEALVTLYAYPGFKSLHCQIIGARASVGCSSSSYTPKALCSSCKASCPNPRTLHPEPPKPSIIHGVSMDNPTEMVSHICSPLPSISAWGFRFSCCLHRYLCLALLGAVLCSA